MPNRRFEEKHPRRLGGKFASKPNTRQPASAAPRHVSLETPDSGRAMTRGDVTLRCRDVSEDAKEAAMAAWGLAPLNGGARTPHGAVLTAFAERVDHEAGLLDGCADSVETGDGADVRMLMMASHSLAATASDMAGGLP